MLELCDVWVRAGGRSCSGGRDCPRSMPCRFGRIDGPVRAVGTSRSLCHAGSGRRTVLFEADGTARTGHTTLRMAWFRADGTASTPCHVGSGGRTVWFGGWDCSHSMPCRFGQVDGLVWGGCHGQDCPVHRAVLIRHDRWSCSWRMACPGLSRAPCRF